MNFKFKKYWRKTGLNKEWGNTLLQIISEKKPRHFLEIGVFCGVTSRNICELLNTIHKGEFSYTGFDLFGEKIDRKLNEIEPEYIKSQKFSNPLKHIYYNLLLKENLNSIESVKKLLREYKNNINLLKGNTNNVLKKINLSVFDFVFVDGGHSYNTVKNDLEILYANLRSKKVVLLCDDYGEESYIPEVKKAIDDFTEFNKLKINLIQNRFAEIIT